MAPVVPAEGAVSVYADGLDLGGLPPIRCWMRWRENDSDLESGSAPRWSMTDDQIASAKRVWHGLRSVNQSTELRAKVAASTAADRARTPGVVVELQDEP